MRSLAIELGDIFVKYCPKLSLDENEKVIQALMADRTEETFTKRVGIGCAKRRFQDFDAGTSRNPCELVVELAVVVAEEVRGDARQKE